MINLAMVGLGRWGQTVLNSIQGKSTRMRVVHGVTKEPDLARDLAAKHRFHLSTELDDAIANPDVQAIMLATPHSLHVEQIKKVAASGKPCWCEKPLALTRAQAEIAIAAVRNANIPFGSGNNKRCFASMREMKRVVESGELGEIMHIEGHYSNEHSVRVSGGWRDDPKESPGAGMTGAGLHVLDAFVNLGGPMSYIDARSVSKKAPPDPRDVVAVLTEFAGGATGQMATVRAAPMVWRIHVFGTKGMAEARGEDTLIVTKIGGEPQQTTYEHVDSLRTLLEAFADAIDGRAPFPVTPEQMLNVIGAFEGVIASLETGKPVRL